MLVKCVHQLTSNTLHFLTSLSSTCAVPFRQHLLYTIPWLTSNADRLVLGFIVSEFMLTEALSSSAELLTYFSDYAAPSTACVYALLSMALLASYNRVFQDTEYKSRRGACLIGLLGEPLGKESDSCTLEVCLPSVHEQ